MASRAALRPLRPLRLAPAALAALAALAASCGLGPCLLRPAPPAARSRLPLAAAGEE